MFHSENEIENSQNKKIHVIEQGSKFELEEVRARKNRKVIQEKSKFTNKINLISFYFICGRCDQYFRRELSRLLYTIQYTDTRSNNINYGIRFYILYIYIIYNYTSAQTHGL